MAEDRDLSGKAAIAAVQYSTEGEYWLNKFSGDLQKTSFLYDYPESNPGRHKNDNLEFQFSRRCEKRLRELSKGLDHRLYIILTAGLVALLYKYTGNQDIIIGSPIFKQEKETHFINTILALRNRVDSHITFKQLLLNRVRQTIVEASEHQNYPIETLLSRLDMPFNREGFPLFDVVILLGNIHEKKYIQHIHPNMMFSFLRSDGGVKGEVEYNERLYGKQTIQGIVRHFLYLMEQVIFDIDMPVAGINMLSEEEKRQVLVDFNNTRTDYPAGKRIDELFEEQAASKPTETAVTFEGEPITYGRLNREADALAVHLRRFGVGPGTPVALMAENSYKVIAAILGILKAGGAYVPVNLEYPPERKRFILRDCNTNLLITNCPGALAGTAVSTVVHLEDSEIYREPSQGRGVSKYFKTRGSRHSLAYIMYTSGSTGTPKGVMVEHRNVVRLVKNNTFIMFKPDDSILLTGALEFDASTFEIWGALLNGLILHLVRKDTILNYEKFKQAVASSGVTIMWLTAPFFNQVLDADIEIFQGLRHLLVGGDVLSPPHINRLRKRFPGLNVINGYGPTENTTFSTTYRIEKEYQKNIPIGKPISNSTAYILESSGQAVPVGVPGELVVGGDGLSRGYLNNPELTAERFTGFHRSYRSYRSYISYRTGDLARWLPDGNIEFLGRIDQQVKLRGYRVELGEIEAHLLQHPRVKEAVVLARQGDAGDKYLCAYIVPGMNLRENGEPSLSKELKTCLSQSLPDYMVPSYVTLVDRVPLTPNGKVDRKALPIPEINIENQYTAPANETEERLVEVWAQVLGIEKGKISVHADFFDLGGHSLKATILISKLHKALNVKVPLAELFRTPTIRELTEFIRHSKKDMFSSLKATEEKEYYRLSSAQKRLYLLQQMSLDSTFYNVPQAVEIEGEPGEERLVGAFKQLIERQESLRTSFHTVTEEPVQRIHPYAEVEFDIEHYPAAGEREWNPVMQRFIRPFDLSRAPLLRVGLKKSGQQRYLLMVDMHHIITDGTSMEFMLKEFFAAYAGEELAPLKFQYKDYAEWQNRSEQQQALKQQEVFWLKQFEGDIPVLDLPYDFPRPGIQSFEGEVVYFDLSGEETRALNELAAAEGATLFMVLLAITLIFLSKLSNQEDIVIGTPIAARRHADLERIIGMFVNTLALRNYPRGEQPFNLFLREIKQRTLTAFENQEYAFEDLVEKVSINRDAGRSPLFDVMFVLQNGTGEGKETPVGDSWTAKQQEVEDKAAKFDLTIAAIKRTGKLFFSFQYCTKLFKQETIQRFIDYFKKVVFSILKNPHQKICNIEMLTQEEKRHILLDFNDTGDPYLNDQTIPQLFESQVEQTPDHIALVGNLALLTHRTYRTYLTYKQLSRTSNQLAYQLVQLGVKKNEIVGLKVERSVEMIIGILGILKAGGAYVPLNPRAPAARSEYILAECSARILVSENIEVIDLNKIGPIGPIGPMKNDLCYVIFTSGSTGQPKGVPITHANLCPLLHWGYRELGLDTKDRFIQNLSYYFDWSVWEIIMALTTGAGLYMVPDDLLLNWEACIAFMNRNKITVLHVTPSQYQYFIYAGVKLETLKYLFLGAETLTLDLLKRSLQSVNRDCRVFNMYGPTECTIISAVLEIKRSQLETFGTLSSVPIGGPVANINLLVLDKYLNPCPVNVAGELYIGGDCVSRGYLNQPELTEERFVKFHRSYRSYRSYNSYRTGDLVRWLPDSPPAGGPSMIEFLGRMDEQVKIRGYRIELGEIESQLVKNPGVKEAVVLALEGDAGEKYLCAYITAWSMEQGAGKGGIQAPTAAELEEYLSQFLPDYMIPSHFIQIDTIPLTPNGKLDRRALPVPDVEEREEYIAPSDEIEETLTSLWSDLLNINKGNISVNANFFQLGGHSLKASMMTSMIHKAFDVKVPLVELFRLQTIRELAKWIKESKKDRFIDIEPVEKREYYDISYTQGRVWLFYKREPGIIAFNMPGTVTLKGSVDVQTIKETLVRLTERHESLRTAFIEKDGKVFQQVKESVEVPFKQIDISHLGEEEKERRYREIWIAEYRVPFDLSRPPLFRVALVKRAEDHWDFIYNLHHIINDGWSQQVLDDEFATFYQALQAGQEPQLEPLSLQYKDFAAWQKQMVCDPDLKEKSLRYWREKLGDGKPLLRLPTDENGSSEDRAGAGYHSTMDQHLKDRLSELAKQHNTTLAAVMFSTFLLLFSEFANREEIDCTLIDAGRDHVSVSRIMGYFVHRFLFKTRVEAGEPFTAYLSRINREVMELFQYKTFPLEAVCEELEIERPDSAIAFNMYSYSKVSVEKKLEPIESYQLPEVQDIKFDIEIYMREYSNGLLLFWAFRKSLFSAETAAYIAAEYNRITEYFARNPGMNANDYCSWVEKQHGLSPNKENRES